LSQDFQQKIQQTNAAVHAKQMDLTVIGPRVLEPGASNQFQIQTRSFRLEPMPARITVAVRDQDNRELFKKDALPSRGDLVVTMPQDLPLKPSDNLVLEVQARSEQDPQIVLSESIPLTDPFYVTHLTVDKPIYQLGETVRFRSLTLQRFSLRPPTEDLELAYKITKPTGEVVTILKCLAAARRAARQETPILGLDENPVRGIGAGEFTIDRQAPPGQYILTVSEVHQRFPPQERKFQVTSRIREGEPPGEPSTRARQEPRPPGVANLGVEFFPEGGDLVAGVPSRVYFQAKTTLNKSIELKGRIVNETGKTVASVTTFRDPSRPEISQGMGMFTFTPQAGKEYQLKIEKPTGIEGKFSLPIAKPDGVVLSIPAGVTTDKEPIKAVIRSVGAGRSLLVGAYCRGRLMSQQSIDVKNGEVKEVELGPESGVGGVYRVTVFERVPDQARGEQFVPRAERLVYRAPAARLRLAIQPDKPSYRPGERVRVRIRATNENNQPQPAIAQVAIVDQKVFQQVNEKTSSGMPAHFLLAPEIHRPEDREPADFLLSAGPQAAIALDLLLGIQSWRRFAEQNPGRFLKEQKEEAQRLLALEGQWPSRSVNYGQEEVQKVVREYQRQYAELQKRLTQAEERQVLVRKTDAQEEKVKELRGQAEQVKTERIASAGHVKDAQESLASAAGNLQRYRDLLRGVVLPAFLVVFLLAAAANLILAVVRRRQGRAIPYLAGAACSLLLVALALSQRANLMQNMATGAGIEVADLSDLPNNDWLAQIKLDEGFGKNATVQKESTNKTRQSGPLLAPIIIGPQPPEKKKAFPNRDATKQDQSAPQDRSNLSPPMPVPPPPPPSFVVREHVHLRSSGDNKDRPDMGGTLFWHPVLVLPDGMAEISFDLSDSVTTYRVIVAGHTLDGRLAEETVELMVGGEPRTK
jgi:hypothetical protein